MTMVQTTIALVPVEWWIDSGDGMPYYRSCDFCYGTATDDIYAGKSEAEWRTFHRQQGGVNDSLTVCSNCMDEYLSEPMA